MTPSAPPASPWHLTSCCYLPSISFQFSLMEMLNFIYVPAKKKAGCGQICPKIELSLHCILVATKGSLKFWQTKWGCWGKQNTLIDRLGRVRCKGLLLALTLIVGLFQPPSNWWSTGNHMWMIPQVLFFLKSRICISGAFFLVCVRVCCLQVHIRPGEDAWHGPPWAY